MDKDAILDRFRQGEQQVIVATSALGMGIDIPDIRGIIHLGRPARLDHGQESGRAGRDGQPSEAIMIVPTPEPPAMAPGPGPIDHGSGVGATVYRCQPRIRCSGSVTMSTG
jgi:hypothetical protein